MKKQPQLKKGKGTALWEKAKKLIPGGNQLLSKRSEMFLPGFWPAYYEKAKGIEVTDLDGKTYLDFSIMGVGACILGYADKDVNTAVKRAVDLGGMSTLNSPEEVELAELLCELHPWAEKARFARTGGESMAVAVRIARAHSGKSTIAFCGYHGWSDWYLATNLADGKSLNEHLLAGLDPAGVPPELQGTVLPFSYNRIDELEALVEKHGDIGVIVVETVRHHEPEDGFLQKVRAIAKRIGAVLIFDEITVGWRIAIGGAHLYYGVTPDIAVLGKSIANGFAMGVIIGTKEVMDSAQKTFISSTFWTERIGPTAALATIRKMKRIKLPAHLSRIGRSIGDGWKKLAHKHGLNIAVHGPEALVGFAFQYGEESQAVRTLFTQEMLRRGFLASGSVYVSYAHTEKLVKRYLLAVDDVFGLLAKAIAEKKVTAMLQGGVAHSGFQRLT
ncbi:MAG: aminotransferase class III-fold pyridoxal phosphate-dependent enzyme [bacterium]|nr:aminotransferase class III-fold pyridoxal phosphate-dependent enzyme [bacterium]